MDGVCYGTCCGESTGEAWVSDIRAVLIDGAARCGEEEQAANPEPIHAVEWECYLFIVQWDCRLVIITYEKGN